MDEIDQVPVGPYRHTEGVLFRDLVAASEAVGATRARTRKVAVLAELLGGVDVSETAAAVGFLVGRARQGRIGIGWRTVAAARPAPAATPALTITDVDETLTAIAGTSGAGSAAARSAALADLLRRATAPEQEFIGRVLVGEVRHGALDGVVTDAIAAAAGVPADVVRRAVMLTGDLGLTAELARTGTRGDLEAITLQVMRPVRPMLAATAESVAAALAALGTASVEHKLDGARIQVHRDGADVRIYTRSLADVTHRLPEVADVVRGLPAEELVLDGESLALDADARPRAFQDTMSRFGADAPRDAQLRPYFFDILRVDGRDLLDEPLGVRLAELTRVVGEWRVDGAVTSDPAAGEQVLESALAAGHEGVVVKALDAPYAAGRRGSSWQKVKPVRRLDLVVLAAEWGYGRRTGWLSNIHLGAYDPDGAFGDPGGFVMVGKTFKGMTDAMLQWQTERFTELATAPVPAGARERSQGTVWLRPVQVVEIALDGVQVSPRYPGGAALRFARVVRYRDDKSPVEADTITAVRALLPSSLA